MAIFKSKPQRIIKKARDMARDDMVDQAAVLIEEEIETILEDREVTRQIIPFLMDIGHPDLAARLSERVIKAYSDLRSGVVKILEEKLGQYARSTELLRVLWRFRLRSKDYNGMIDLLSTVDRLTESRFTDSIESTYNAQAGFSGEEIRNTEPFLAMAVVLYRKGRAAEAVEVLAETAERSPFPDESLARLSGWIANRTGGVDMDVNLGWIRTLVALSDTDRAVAELGTLFQADQETLEKAIAITEKSLVRADTSGRASIALARLMAAAGRIGDACTILEGMIDWEVDVSLLDQAATGVVMAAPASARPHLLQARLRIARGEITLGMESLEKVFDCSDLDQSPVAEVCRSVIEGGMDREGRVSRKLGEFLVERGTVEDAVQIVLYQLEQDPDWVFTQIQKLLQREKANASVLTLLAVHKSLAGREGEAGATLQHLSSRKDLKSRSDAAQVLSRLSHLMDRFPRLRRFRALVTSGIGGSTESASDWLALVLKGEKAPETGYLGIFDNGLAHDRSREILESGFTPTTPAGHLVLATAAAAQDDAVSAGPSMAAASREKDVAERVAALVSDMRLSFLHKTLPEAYLPALNDAGRGDVVAKILPLLAEPDAREDWMDTLAFGIDTGDVLSTAMFRLEYFIESGRFGTAAVSVESLRVPAGPAADLAAGCRAAAAEDRTRAVELLSAAAADPGTARMAMTVLESLAGDEKSGPTTLALARALISTGDLSGAAGVLAKCPESVEILEFLEENTPRHQDSWELWKLLALARLSGGDHFGFRAAAGTALEMSPSPAKELASAALDRGGRSGDTELLFFGVAVAVRHDTGMDVSGPAADLLRSAPHYHGQLELLGFDHPEVVALLGIASRNHELLLSSEFSGKLDPPAESVDRCLELWTRDGYTEALYRLLEFCTASGLAAQAHRARVALAGKSFPEVEKGLLEDARAGGAARLDFWNLVRSDELLRRGLSEFMPPGTPPPPDEAAAAASALAESGLDGGAIMSFAMRLADSDDPDVKLKSSLLVDKVLESCTETATPELIRLLAAAGKTGAAFRAARGDDHLLAALREAVAGLPEPDPSPEELLWRSGRREAACAGWLANYRSTGDTACLTKLHWGLSQMGLPAETAALERFIFERHPDLCTSFPASRGRAWVVNALDIRERHTGRGMTNDG